MDSRYRSAMASALEREATTRRWRRVEYERLVDLGVFVGERLELLDGVLVVREPQGSPHAAIVSPVVAGWMIDTTGNWTWPFVGSMLLLAIGAVLAFRMRPEQPLSESGEGATR